MAEAFGLALGEARAGSAKTPLYARASKPLLLASLGLSLGACYNFGAGQAESDCRPGELGCVCDRQQSCDDGLVCSRDRCFEAKPGDEGAVEDADDNSTEDAKEPSKVEEDPDPKKDDESAGPEDSTGEPDPDPETTPEAAPDCKDGEHNAKETDVDCGGPECPGCKVGQRCAEDGDCLSKSCGEQGTCVDLPPPECVSDEDCNDGNDCTVDRCVNSACTRAPAADGTACDNKNSCTINDRCQKGSCKAGKSLVVMDENFERKNALLGWRFGRWRLDDDDFDGPDFEEDRSPERRRTAWKLGVATASSCGGKRYGEDPSEDHSPGPGNRVVGTDVGGCQLLGVAPNWDCIWTAYVDVSEFKTGIRFSFWKQLHAPGWQDDDDDAPEGARHRLLYRYRGQDQQVTIRDMEQDTGTNDRSWRRLIYTLPRPIGAQREISLGLCYQRTRRAGRFAGWSVDDVLVRPVGCLEKR